MLNLPVVSVFAPLLLELVYNHVAQAGSMGWEPAYSRLIANILAVVRLSQIGIQRHHGIVIRSC